MSMCKLIAEQGLQRQRGKEQEVVESHPERKWHTEVVLSYLKDLCNTILLFFILSFGHTKIYLNVTCLYIFLIRGFTIYRIMQTHLCFIELSKKFNVILVKMIKNLFHYTAEICSKQVPPSIYIF